MENKNKVFAKRLYDIMNIRGKKQVDVAKDLDIPKSSVSQYLKGNGNPTTDRLLRLASYFNVNHQWLCGFDVPMEATPQIVAAYHHDNPKKNELIKIIQQTNIPDTNIDLLIQMIESWNFPKNDI